MKLKHFQKKLKKDLKKNNLKTVATWLPVFNGYYNSVFDGSDSTIDYEIELDESEYQEHYEELFKAGVSHEFFMENLYNYIDFSDCYESASSNICDGLLNLDDTGIIKNVIFEKTVSPKYYNFSTDSINCKIQYDFKKLGKYVLNNFEKYTDYINEKYTSRDGFISSYSSDVNNWLNFSDLSEHELGSILNFVFFNEDQDAILNLYYESNISEAFLDYKLDTENFINDFKNQKKAV